MTSHGTDWSDPSMKLRKLSTSKWKGIGKTLSRLAIPALVATASFAATAQTPNQMPAGVRHAGNVARAFDRRNPDTMVNVIVQFKVTPTTAHYQRMATRGAAVRTRLHSIRAAAFRLP